MEKNLTKLLEEQKDPDAMSFEWRSCPLDSIVPWQLIDFWIEKRLIMMLRFLSVWLFMQKSVCVHFAKTYLEKITCWWCTSFWELLFQFFHIQVKRTSHVLGIWRLYPWLLWQKFYRLKHPLQAAAHWTGGGSKAAAGGTAFTEGHPVGVFLSGREAEKTAS